MRMLILLSGVLPLVCFPSGQDSSAIRPEISPSAGISNLNKLEAGICFNHPVTRDKINLFGGVIDLFTEDCKVDSRITSGQSILNNSTGIIKIKTDHNPAAGQYYMNINHLSYKIYSNLFNTVPVYERESILMDKCCVMLGRSEKRLCAESIIRTEINNEVMEINKPQMVS